MSLVDNHFYILPLKMVFSSIPSFSLFLLLYTLSLSSIIQVHHFNETLYSNNIKFSILVRYLIWASAQFMQLSTCQCHLKSPLVLHTQFTTFYKFNPPASLDENQFIQFFMWLTKEFWRIVREHSFTAILKNWFLHITEFWCTSYLRKNQND